MEGGRSFGERKNEGKGRAIKQEKGEIERRSKEIKGEKKTKERREEKTEKKKVN